MVLGCGLGGGAGRVGFDAGECITEKLGGTGGIGEGGDVDGVGDGAWRWTRSLGCLSVPRPMVRAFMVRGHISEHHG